MDKRIVFNSKEIRDLFFEKVLNVLNLKKWVELRKMFNISRSALEAYRNGKLTLPEELYEGMSKNLSEKDKIWWNNTVKFLDSNWGSVRGGKITYSKYKLLFDAGRAKAIAQVQAKTNKFDVRLPLDHRLSYFLGLFVGDGFTNKYYAHYLIQFTGDKRYELPLYEHLMSDYSKKLFNLRPILRQDKHKNVLRFNLYSKQLFDMITQRFNISAGRKSRTVLIPEEILNSRPEIIKSFLRGLYDAEGCVFLDKRKNYKKPYPRIELHMCNLALLKQVSDILTKYKIKNVLGTSENNLRVTIWGFEEVSKFIREIGFSNPKQLKKIEGLKD